MKSRNESVFSSDDKWMADENDRTSRSIFNEVDFPKVKKGRKPV